MAVNFFDTHTLLASVQLLPPLHTFLLDRYFPTNEASDIFSTDDVLVEYKKGNKMASPFVAPRKGGITILRDGYTMKQFTPSYIAPKRPLTLDELKKRRFGEALYRNLTPAQRQGAIIAATSLRICFPDSSVVVHFASGVYTAGLDLPS